MRVWESCEDCTSFSQHFLLAVSIFYACSQPIRICFFATYNMIYLSATTRTYLQHLVHFCGNYQPDTTIWSSDAVWYTNTVFPHIVSFEFGNPKVKVHKAKGHST